uniref:Protein nlrc3 n=1 Tax=Rhipicephalus appendiculatus TaxID=34631 RepID=A0A131YJ90_RHIAP
MADGVMSEADTQNTEVMDLFRKGLEEHVPHGDPDRDSIVVSSESMQRGAELTYTENLSEKDAAVLRRMLRTGPPVRQLTLWQISLAAFRVAFQDLEECPSLKEINFLLIDCEGKDLGISVTGVFRNLQSLDLRCDNPGSGFAKDIAGYIRQNKSLRELSLWNSCGGDEGAAILIEALAANDTLKKFTLASMELSSDTLLDFARMLTSNSTLEVVDLFDVCPAEKDKLSSLLEQELCADVFKRLKILWPQELLPELTALLRKGSCYRDLSVSVTSTVDEGVLREFFDAVAADKMLQTLHFYPSEESFDALADGIASVVRRTTTLREICNLMRVQEGKEHQLVVILEALKENSCVTSFTMYAELLNADIVKSLSELLAVNSTLVDVAICEYWGILPEQVETILQGLRKNNTLTGLMVSWDPDESDGITEMEEILKRNARLRSKAAECASSGSHDVSDAKAAD